MQSVVLHKRSARLPKCSNTGVLSNEWLTILRSRIYADETTYTFNVYTYAHVPSQKGADGGRFDAVRDDNAVGSRGRDAMRRSGAALPFVLVRPAILAFVALLVALLFATPCALAEEPVPGGSILGGAQNGCPEDQQFTATLYDNGELVIEKAKPIGSCGSQDANTVDPGSEGGEAGHKPETSAVDGGAPIAPAESQNVSEDRSAKAAPSVDKVLAQGAPIPDDASPRRTAVETYSNVVVSIDRPDGASWYNNRGNIKSVSFGQGVDPESLAFWFTGLSNLSDINFAGLDTSKVTSMQSLFDGCGSLKKLDLNTFDTSNVTNMSRLFAGCSSLTSLDLSGFDTRKVTSTDDMLKGCSSLAALDLSSFSAGQLAAMAVPVDNAGGYWRLNVPAGFVTNVVLREPTAAERAEAGLKPLDPSGDNGRSNGSNASSGAASNAAARLINSIISPAGTIVTDATGEAAERVLVLAAPFGVAYQTAPLDRAGAGVTSNDLVAEAAARLLANRFAALARAATADAVSAVGKAHVPPLDVLVRGAANVAAAIADPVESVGAMADNLVTPSRSNPMLPLGIPFNLFATTVLLVVVIPSTFLLFRDRR